MSAFVLVLGKILGEIRTLPTKNGGIVTFFKLKVANGNALDYWDCATFSDSVREELAGLGEGDALSVTGAFRVEPYEHQGTTRFSLKITVDRALSTKTKPKEAKAKGGATARAVPAPTPSSERGHDHDDEIPF